MQCHGSLLDKYVKELYLVVFFILLKNITTIGYHVDTHRIAKRMDLESCLGQFDVHRDTIIRTEESLSIGGKYLQGVSIETSEECQHLCCETENCDVYIFEGKGGGYCYLFECGPPENFRCKFTRHTNYTSAVLTPIRHVTVPPTIKPPPSQPQVSSQLNPNMPSLSQHELELTNLKQKPDNGNIQLGRTSSTAIPPLGVRVLQYNTTPKNVASSQSACGRFQFQCHSGECIAVYNACDGIPQCEDGSDEGPECPSSSVAAIKPSLPDVKTEEVGLHMDQASRVPAGDVMMPMPKQSEVQSIPRAYQQAVIQPPNINNREDPMSSPPVWSNRKMQEAQDVEHNSRIFNHKGGIQIAANNMAQPYPNPASSLYNSIQRDMYMQPEYQVPYHNPIIIQPQDHMSNIQQQNINWQNQPQQSMLPGGPYIAAVNGQPVPQVKAVPVQQEQLVDVPKAVDRHPEKQPNSAIVAEGAAGTGNSKHSEAKSSHNGSNESDAYEEYEEKSTEAPKKKLRKHKKPSDKEGKTKGHSTKTKSEKPLDSPVHEQYKMIKDSLEMEFVDHDGQSERPGGAVLSLTLGIIVTAALAVLVGCRMRTVGRRVRRVGKAPYGHDADFLVNGMYL